MSTVVSETRLAPDADQISQQRRVVSGDRGGARADQLDPRLGELRRLDRCEVLAQPRTGARALDLERQRARLLAHDLARERAVCRLDVGLSPTPTNTSMAAAAAAIAEPGSSHRDQRGAAIDHARRLVLGIERTRDPGLHDVGRGRRRRGPCAATLELRALARRAWRATGRAFGEVQLELAPLLGGELVVEERHRKRVDALTQDSLRTFSRLRGAVLLEVDRSCRPSSVGLDLVART